MTPVNPDDLTREIETIDSRIFDAAVKSIDAYLRERYNPATGTIYVGEGDLGVRLNERVRARLCEAYMTVGWRIAEWQSTPRNETLLRLTR